jgi:pyruvate dehydrogenase E2 component (dihydrolipoamide acetyltransferase)
MSNEITMPKLSDTMEEGKILRWLKHPGDQIRRGDAIAEVETDKADMVMESFDEGVLEEVRLKEGESARVGAVIATLRTAGGAQTSPTASRPEDASAAMAQPSERTSADEAAEAAENPAEIVGAEPEAPAARPQATGRVAPLRGARRRRNGAIPGPGAQAETATEGVRPRQEEESGAEEAGLTDGVGAPPPEFHPAMSGHPSAAPTAIAAPPPRSMEIARAPESGLPEHHEGGKFRASPLARRAAEEAGIDLSQVRGTGPDGRITKRDVDNYLREQQLFKFRRLVAPREGLPGTREELSKMRKTIAHRMAQSKREIPHFYVTVEVDMEEAVKLKNSLEATELFEEDISYNDIIIKATALALSRYTRMNASYQDDGIVIYPNINIGMAVAVEDGLIVPVIHECERKSLPEIAAAAHRLVSKAARGGFSGDDLSGGTFTISNMGMLGVEHFAAVIVPPQAAILAVSAVKEKPVVRNGQVVVGKTMMITVACDHRIIDGVVGARFVNEIKRFLENPASLLIS